MVILYAHKYRLALSQKLTNPSLYLQSNRDFIASFRMFLQRDIHSYAEIPNGEPPGQSKGPKEFMPNPSPKSFSLRSVLPIFLRAGRLSKYSPSWRGVNALSRLYRKIIPEDLFFRVDDIDQDLIFDVNLRSNMGLYLWHYPRLFEKEQRELFCASITPGCTVLDVGANIGFYTLLAAKRGAQVFAIEADPVMRPCFAIT